MSNVPDTETVRSPGRRRFLRWAFGSSLLCVPTGVYAHEVEPEGLVVAHQDIRIDGWPQDLDGLRIGHLSDTHCDSERAVDRTTRAAKLLQQQNPDMVFLTGDYVTNYPHIWAGPAAEALAPLAGASRGAFAVLGNHDGWSGDPDHVGKCLEGQGFSVLRNDARPMTGHKNVWIVGLEYRCDDLQDPDEAVKGIPANAVKLLLIHEPDYADESPPGFAHQFSGHSHGGQVRIPGLPPIDAPRHGRRYPEGLSQGKSHPVYTTRGVGMVSPKFRLFCPPEVGVITVKRA